MTEPQAAATVMIVRGDRAGIEVFLLRRSSRSAFMPDVFVFPGGRVEPQDGTSAARARLAGPIPAVDAAYVHAAVRETFEECGVLFATDPIDPLELAAARERTRSGASTFTGMLGDLHTFVDTRELRYFSRWITPPIEGRRFDTRFFVARMPAGQTAQADAVETLDGRWIAPRDALACHAAGSFALIFPTIKHLERLSTFGSVDELLEYATNKPIQPVMPTIDAQQLPTIPALLEGKW